MTEKELNEIRTGVSHLQLNITNNDAEFQDLKNKVNKLESVKDANSAYQKHDTLIISRDIPAVTEHENCDNIVPKDNLNVNLHFNDLSTAHHLEKRPVAPVDKHIIIFKLCNRENGTS